VIYLPHYLQLRSIYYLIPAKSSKLGISSMYIRGLMPPPLREYIQK